MTPISFMSGTYCGWMPLAGFLKKRWPVIAGKKIGVVANGIGAPDDQASQKTYKKIPENIRAGIKFWKIPGKPLKNLPTFGLVSRENLKSVVEFIKA